MVRGKDTCWEYCVLVDANRQKVRCNFCQREFSGGVYRMKFHLAQIKNKDIVPCTNVPIEIRDRIWSLINSPKKQKSAKKPKLDQQSIPENNNTNNGHQNSSSSSGEFQHQNKGQSSGHLNISTCPSVDRGQQEFDDDANIQKRKQDEADKRIAMFFFNNCVPLGAAKSSYYQEMIDSISQCGVGYKAPSFETLRSSLLERVKLEIHDRFKRYRDEWRETGCTIICDNWSDFSIMKSIAVLSVTSPKGSLFLKSVNISDNKDNPNFLFSLIESAVLEIGVQNVVQVVTENSASFAYAGRLLMAKYNSLLWSLCTLCCIDMILEDFGTLDWVKTVLEEAAAAFLNPSVFYDRSFKVDPRLRNGFQEAMMRIAITEIDNIDITKE